MKHWMRTREGKKLYAKRKSTIEPVFGVIKAVMGFRQFLKKKGCFVYTLNLYCISGGGLGKVPVD